MRTVFNILAMALVVGVLVVQAAAENQPAAPSLESPSKVEALQQNVTLVQDLRGLWRTENGRTWSLIHVPKEFNSSELECFYFESSEVGVISIRGRLFRTVDSGNNWVPLGKVPVRVTDCAFSSSQTGWLLGRKSESRGGDIGFVLMSSTDGAKTWKEEELPASISSSQMLRSVSFYGPMNGWISGDGVIGRTRDGGRHWETVYNGRRAVEKVTFDTPQLGWATQKDSSDLLITTDGGDHWRESSGPPQYGDWNASAVCFSQEYCFVAMMHLYVTHDGGRTWRRAVVNSPVPLAWISYLGVRPDRSLLLLAVTKHEEAPIVLLRVGRESKWAIGTVTRKKK